jgi:hypothetical protein
MNTKAKKTDQGPPMRHLQTLPAFAGTVEVDELESALLSDLYDTHRPFETEIGGKKTLLASVKKPDTSTTYLGAAPIARKVRLTLQIL